MRAHERGVRPLIGVHHLLSFAGFQLAFLVPIECDDDMVGHRQFQASNCPRGFVGALIDDLVIDLLPFIQAAEAGPFERADMDEHMGAAGVGLNESNAFVALNHFTVPVATAAPLE